MKNKFLSILLISSIISAPIFASDTAITIYSNAQAGAIDPNSYSPVTGNTNYYSVTNIPGYAVVKQTRNIDLNDSENIIKFSDVAAYIDPTTVQFKSLTDPTGTKIVEQNYQFDLVSQQKLLEKYIDKKISIESNIGDKSQIIDGTLISTQGGLTLKTSQGIKAINNYSGINFSELPSGLITKPTLVWDIITNKIGEHRAEVSYKTQGVTWWADYNLTYKEGKNANSGTVDFGSWVSIINQSGATYDNAKLKLIAGNVARNNTPQPPVSAAMGGMELQAKPSNAPEFAEKSFFEYHLYTLNRPVTLPDNSTKQLELIPAVNTVPVEKLFIYNAASQYINNYGGVYISQNDGFNDNKKVNVFLKLVNKKENGLGVPLPAGRIRVSQKDSDGGLEFIGESIIDHTPNNEELLIKLGNAFDIVGERKQLNYSLDNRNRNVEEEIEIKIRNQKKQSVQVKVIENMYRTPDWDIINSSAKYKKENSNQISYLVDAEPESEQIIKYKVRYKWQ